MDIQFKLQEWNSDNDKIGEVTHITPVFVDIPMTINLKKTGDKDTTTLLNLEFTNIKYDPTIKTFIKTNNPNDKIWTYQEEDLGSDIEDSSYMTKLVENVICRSSKFTFDSIIFTLPAYIIEQYEFGIVRRIKLKSKTIMSHFTINIQLYKDGKELANNHDDWYGPIIYLKLDPDNWESYIEAKLNNNDK